MLWALVLRLSLWWRDNTQTISFVTLYGGQFTLSTQLIGLYYWGYYYWCLIQFKILETNFLRVVWRTVRSITNEIFGLKGLNFSLPVGTKSIHSFLGTRCADLFCLFWSFYRAVKTFYQAGLVVEPSGAAAFAALQANKIPDLSEGSNVVAIVTGGNVTPEELCDLMNCN